MDEVVCRQCKEVKFREILYKRKKSYAYVDEADRHWNGTQCPDCYNLETKLRIRIKKNSVHRSKSTNPKHIKGYRAEELAARKFEAMGYKVSISEGNGPDLVCVGKFKTINVEVKSVSVDSRNRWRTSKIYEERKKDDYVCIVFSDEHVVIQPMSYFLSLAAPDGRRSVITLHPSYKPHPRSIHA